MKNRLLTWIESWRDARMRKRRVFDHARSYSAWCSMAQAASEELFDGDLSRTFSLPPTTSYEALIQCFLDTALQSKPEVFALEQQLADRFGALPAEATGIIDRALGGVARAAARNPALCPDPARDPVAWHSFQRAWDDPSIVTTIYGDGFIHSSSARHGPVA